MLDSDYMSIDQYRQVVQETESLMLLLDEEHKILKYPLDQFMMSGGVRLMPSSGRLSPLNNIPDLYGQ